MKVEWRKITDIRPYENNPRKNDGAVNAVAASIREFGFRQPIVVDRDGVIICGHTRYKAALKLGLQEVPVHVAIDLTPEQVRAYRIADNQTATLSTWDSNILPIEVAELQKANVNLELLGFDSDVLERLLTKNEPSETDNCRAIGYRLQSLWQVVVECDDEADQRKLYEQLTAEGYRCRLLVL